MAEIVEMIEEITGGTEEELRIKGQLGLVRELACAKSQVFEDDLGRKLANREIAGYMILSVVLTT